MTRLFPIPCLVALLTACASAPPERTAAPRTVVEMKAGDLHRWDFNPESGVSLDSLGVPASSAWLAIPAAYARFGLGTSGHAADRVVTAHAKARRTLGGVRLSRMVECGSPLGVKRADHYTITLAIATRVDSLSPGRSALRTRVQATGFDPMANDNVITCATTGFLESAIADEVQARAK